MTNIKKKMSNTKEATTEFIPTKTKVKCGIQWT